MNFSATGYLPSKNSVGASRRAQEQCGSFKQVNSTYNDENAIPPYTGVMFEMFSKVNIELLSLELDVRFENGVEDLSIEVYTKEGGFSAFVNDESAWEKVADSTMVRAPEGVGAIIPIEDFTPIAIARRTKRSFYLTMRGPFIDFTAYALQKTGEIFVKGGDFDILVGSGLTEYKFPAKIDRILDPQFAGVIHYKRVTQECDNLVSTAEVEFRFLYGEDMDDPFFDTLNGAFNEFVADTLQNNPNLSAWVEEFGIQLVGTETVSAPFAGQCPPVWPVCPTTYLITKLSLEHGDVLRSGLVKFEFLKSTERAIGVANAAGQGVQALYLGDQSVGVEFVFTLEGVPTGEMDRIQQDYFEDVCRSFIDSTAKERYSSVLAVVLDTQTVQRNLLREGPRRSLSPVLLTGSISGAIPAAFKPDHFRETLDIAFGGGSEALVSALHLGGLRPSKITEGNRIEYFLGLSSISPVFKEIVKPAAPTASASSGLSNASIAMIEGAAFLVFLVAAAWGMHSYSSSQNNKRKAEERRRQRRNEKKRKDDKTESQETTSLLSRKEKGKLSNNTKQKGDGDKEDAKTNSIKSQSPAEGLATSSANAPAKGPTKAPAKGPAKPKTTQKGNLKRTLSSPAVVQQPRKPNLATQSAKPQTIPGKKMPATKQNTIPGKRPTLSRTNSAPSRTNSAPVVGKSPTPMTSNAKQPNGKPVVPKVGPKTPGKTLGGNVPPVKRPGVAKSQSMSTLKVGSVKGAPNAKQVVPGKVTVGNGSQTPATTAVNGRPRPVLQKSLSVSALANTNVTPAKVAPGIKTKTAASTSGKAPGPTRPPIKRSLSANVGKSSTAVSTKAPSGASAQKVGLKPAVVRPSAQKVGLKPAVVRPALQRSMSVSAIGGNKQALAKPPLLRKQGPGAAQPKSTSTLGPGKAAAIASAPKSRPTVQRSASVSALGTASPSLKVPITTSQKPKGGASIPSGAQGPATTPVPSKPGTKPPGINSRPALQRSASVSVLGTKTQPLKKQLNVGVKPKTAGEGKQCGPIAAKPPGTLLKVRPNLQRSLSVSALTTQTAKPGTTKPNPKIIAAAKPQTKVQTDASTELNTKQTCVNSQAPKIPQRPNAARPNLQRSASVSALTKTQPAKPGAMKPNPKMITAAKPQPKTQTDASPELNAEKTGLNNEAPKVTQKPPATRPNLQRSLSVSALATQAQKPSTTKPNPKILGAAKTNLSVKLKTPTGLKSQAPKVPQKARPNLQRSLSVSAMSAKLPIAPGVPASTANPAAMVSKPSVKNPPTVASQNQAPKPKPALTRSLSVSAMSSTKTQSLGIKGKVTQTKP